MNMKIQKNKLVALILMLIPIISIIGVIIYIIDMLKDNYSMLEMVVVILTIPFGFLLQYFYD